MPKLKPDTQRARREHILDAAELCFARNGFHSTTIANICREAEVSPGAVYVYFASKEDLIAGIAERDRAEFAENFAKLGEAPDFLKALSSLGEHYFAEQPAYKRQMCVEIGVESTRNANISRIFSSVDTFVQTSFQSLFERLKTEGRIAPTLDMPTLAKVFCIIGDGMIWRRVTEPGFDAKALMPAIISLVRSLLNPIESSEAYLSGPDKSEVAL